MNADEWIDLLQGIKAGREWGVRWKDTQKLVKQVDSSLANAMAMSLHHNVERLELMPEYAEIMCNGAWVPAPLRAAPKHGDRVYRAAPANREYCQSFQWNDNEVGYGSHLVLWLERGLLHSTHAAAAKHGHAMLQKAL
jgi:hypothetical protein